MMRLVKRGSRQAKGPWQPLEKKAVNVDHRIGLLVTWNALLKCLEDREQETLRKYEPPFTVATVLKKGHPGSEQEYFQLFDKGGRLVQLDDRRDEWHGDFIQAWRQD